MLFGVMVNQWQAINKMSKSLTDLLKQTTEGLFMPSESEYPFNVVYWEFFNLNETTIQQKTGIIGNVRTVTIDDFFQGVTKQEDWYEEEERNLAKRFEGLVLVLKNNLAEAKVYEIGDKEVHAYILGTKDDEIIGISTVVIRT
ncbi:sugar nuclease inhibitor NuiA [Cylindrospermopsis raciborskii S07]|uniref:Sugar nuclease inhibitor NuiA n=4 Tax=Cylindrospermopsis raciborskii TaxID=77022 RepID=A0A853MCV6_9CYAN|nr:sugar-non-specific nuclease inhibitor NuiA-like protein [Cylindrospermopsis raciborskii CS-505]PNJ93042.1 sugar nuclease inhibitor NuiA [Cylindrospermopsis raciborskii C03]PNJ93777.1 sugar nuclease inhibitor NuiA [Cylindrospermopsis raciborskii C04]PNJ94706.1 sugar nuclease inhibitor NuiA [Cylindrospermopsis raciborskii C07]PNK02123.1 sugar nuclease inhibitor NuiA [Cylindrospermopsis raciborskii S14]PNK03394.1 sugar nuclease inhibitor NuiA [Cylindrospermopsis raciborskii S07]PNK03811.1 sug